MTTPTFADLGLNPLILEALTAENYLTPTPIQAEALPIVMAGKDIIALAQTGTGKTAAFTLPLLHRLLEDRRYASRRGGKALILTPTRELAMQIVGRVMAYGANVRLRCILIVGGMPMGPQIRKMNDGADIIVATPGRLLDHMGQGTVHLDDTSIVVLDEADQMMDMGFAPALKEISQALPKERQTLMFSATMPPAIRELAKSFLNDPVEIKTANTGRSIDQVEQQAFLIDASNKKVKITQLLLDPAVTSAIVFTRTKFGADRLEKHLNMYGVSSSAIHGDKSQNKRTRALDLFKQGKVKALVATDVAARGIDVSNVSHVINFELPNVSETYLHRIGRTGRAGATGVAWSLVDRTEKAYLRDIEKTINQQIDTLDVRNEKIALPAPAPVDMSIFDEPRRGRSRYGEGSEDVRADRATRYGKPARPRSNANGTDRPDRPARAERRGYEPLPLAVDDGVEALSVERPKRDFGPRPDRAERPAFGTRNGPGPSRTTDERAERPERAGRPERAARPERAGRPERADRPARSERPAYAPRGDRPARPAADGARAPYAPRGGDRPDRAARPERSERPAYAPRSDRAPDRAERPARPERSAARPERSEYAARPARGDFAARPARGDFAARPARGDFAARPARGDFAARAARGADGARPAARPPARPWTDRSAPGADSPRAPRPAFGRSDRARPDGARSEGSRPERPRSDARPDSGRPPRSEGFSKPTRVPTRVADTLGRAAPGTRGPAGRPSAGRPSAGRPGAGRPTGGRPGGAGRPAGRGKPGPR